MNQPQAQILKELRAVIKMVREEHAAVLKENPPNIVQVYGAPRARLSMDTRRKLRPVQMRLQLLVPLYRSMVALAQQKGDGTKAESKYRKKFRALTLGLAHATRDGAVPERLVLDSHPDVQALVPQRDAAPVQWEGRSLKQLYEDQVEELRVYRESHHVRTKVAESARNDFVQSLTAVQLDLLFKAINQARVAGSAGLLLLPGMLPVRDGEVQ